MTQVRHFMEGVSIYLRDVRESDVNETYRDWMNDPEVNQFLESRFVPATLESIADFVRMHTADRDHLFLAIVLRDGDRHVGNIKLGPINWIHRFGDIGLMIGAKDCWGKGIASEAISLLVGYAFSTLNLHKVTAGAYSTNQGSIRAFEKVGFEIEGVRKAHFLTGQGYCDHVLMGLVKDQWETRSKR